jgi:hypothetical protein
MAERTIGEIMEALARIETSVDSIALNSADHEARIRALEGKSGKRWDAVITTTIAAVITLIVGVILGKFI